MSAVIAADGSRTRLSEETELKLKSNWKPLSIHHPESGQHHKAILN